MPMIAAILLTLLSPRENPGEIADLIRQLGDDDYTLREQAMENLASTGDKALPLLKAAAAGDDPEIRRRANLLISLLEWGVPYTLYRKTGNLMEGYADLPDDRKRSVLGTIMEHRQHALPILRKIVERDPAMLPHALQYISEIDAPAAVRICEEQLAAGNEAVDIFRILLRSAMQAKEYEKALAIAKRAVDRWPADTDFHQSIPRALHDLRQYEKAAGLYEQMARKEEFKTSRISILRSAAEEYLAAGKSDAALRCLRSAADDEACGQGEFLSLINTCKRFRLPNDAIALCERRLTSSTDIAVVDELASLYNETRQFAKTLKLFEQYGDTDIPVVPTPRRRIRDLAAVAYKRSGDRKKAEAALRKPLEKENASVDDYLRCAEALKNCHLGEETLRCYTDALKRFPQDRNLLITVAHFHENCGKYREALETLRSAPNAEGIFRARIADLERYNGNDDKAVELWKSDPLLHDAGGSSWPSGLVRTLAYAGRIDEAIAECEKIRKDHPENKPARDSLIHLLIGAGRYDEAVELFPGDGSDRIGAFNREGLLILCREKALRFEDAGKLWRARCERDPSPYNLRRLADVLFRGKKYDEAAKTAAMAGDGASTYLIAYLQGRIAEARGDNEQAVLCYLTAAERSHSESVDKKLKYLGKAPDFFSALLSKHEERLTKAGGESLALLSRLYERAGKKREAAAAFRRYVEAEKSDNPGASSKSEDLTLALGNTYERLSMTDDAIAVFEAFLKDHPEDVRPLYHLADLEKARGNRAKADGLLKEASLIGVDDPTPLHFRYLSDAGKPEYARLEAEKIVNLITDDAVYDANAVGALAGIAVDAEDYAAAARHTRRQAFIIEAEGIMVSSDTSDDITKAYVRALAFSYNGKALEKTGKKSEAEMEFLKAVKTWHPFLPAHEGLARTSSDEAVKTREREFVLNRFAFEIETEPLNPENHYEMGRFLLETGAPPDECRKSLTKALELDPGHAKARELLKRLP